MSELTVQEQFKDIVFSSYQTLYDYPTFEKVVEAIIECRRLGQLLDEMDCDNTTYDLFVKSIEAFNSYVLATAGMIAAKAFSTPKNHTHLRVLYRNQLATLTDLTFMFIEVSGDDTGVMYDFHVFTNDVTAALNRLLDNYSDTN